MKNVRLLITEKGLEVLNAFMEENYLGNYIVENESDLYYKNILNFPNILLKIKDDIVLVAKDNITQDDEYVWLQSLSDMKRKNATYYSLIFDTETREIKELKNESDKVILPFNELDAFDKLNKIESIIFEKTQEDCMEM